MNYFMKTLTSTIRHIPQNDFNGGYVRQFVAQSLRGEQCSGSSGGWNQAVSVYSNVNYHSDNSHRPSNNMPTRSRYNYHSPRRPPNRGYSPRRRNIPQNQYNRRYHNSHDRRNYFRSPKKFYCNFCDRNFFSFFQKKTHENEEHKPMGCEFCSEMFRVKPDLYIHKLRCPERPGQQVVEEPKPPSPPPAHAPDNAVVQSSTTTTTPPPDNPTGETVEIKVKQELPENNNAEEATEKKLPCSYCIKTFPTDDALNKHILRVHTGGSASLNPPTRLNSTIQMKTRSGPFPCPFCAKKFLTRRQLHFHMKGVHTAVFYCNVCPAEFKSKKKLNRHVYSEHVSKEK